MAGYSRRTKTGWHESLMSSRMNGKSWQKSPSCSIATERREAWSKRMGERERRWRTMKMKSLHFGGEQEPCNLFIFVNCLFDSRSVFYLSALLLFINEWLNVFFHPAHHIKLMENFGLVSSAVICHFGARCVYVIIMRSSGNNFHGIRIQAHVEPGWACCMMICVLVPIYGKRGPHELLP